MKYIKQVEGLALMISCGCNLNCSYCDIAKSAKEHKNAAEIQRKTIEALKNNSFIYNVKKGLERINNSSEAIQRIDFWGQEPTLTLNYVTDNFAEWKKVFPNVKTYMFSTNGVGNIDRILDFIDALDNTYDDHVNLHLQFSYDGIESNQECRGLDSNRVKNNIIYFLQEVNKKPLKHMYINVAFHNVVSIELINSLTSIESINKYIKNLYETVTEFGTINTHKNVEVRPVPDAGIEVPVKASTEDGLNFYRFYQMLNRAEENIKRNFIVSNNILNFEEKAFDAVIDIVQEVCHKSPYKALLEWAEDPNILAEEAYNSFNHSSYCGAYLGELKVMYDGTIVNCHSQIFDTQEEDLKDRPKNLRNSVLYGLAKHGRYPNLITSTDEELEKVFYLASTAKQHNFFTSLNQVASLMYLMAKYHQIDKSYLENHEKLLHHAMVIAKMNVCATARLVVSGSIFFTNAGQIRFFCNGLLDEIFSYIDGRFYRG